MGYASNNVWRRKDPKNAVRYQIVNARNRAKKRGLPFNITIDDFLPLPSHCPVFGIELDYASQTVNAPNTFSIDRVDNSQGYIKGNVAIISRKANVLKRDSTLEDLKAPCYLGRQVARLTYVKSTAS